LSTRSRVDETARPSESSGPAPDDLSALAMLSGELINAIERDDQFLSLRQVLGRFCPFENFLVYMFDETKPPVLLGTSVPEARLKEQMADFVAGLFLLDPFILAVQRDSIGPVRLRDIIPEGFFESEYYNHHYRYTNVRDEVRYVVSIDHQRWVHIFVEREAPSLPFSDKDVARLAALAPIVNSFISARCRWLDRLRTPEGDRMVAAIDLQARIRMMSNGALTSRECEVVEWMLKGHSARSIGQRLRIEKGTVTNHKRSIYAKLDIHSMAQLFSLFLRSLTSI
jgi:DNA-binding CsgD family transcriptional regulator